MLHKTIVLETVGPIHVGCGEEISKKEYICEEGQIYVFDSMKMYRDICNMGLREKYERFLMNSKANAMELTDWLEHNEIGEDIYTPWIKYRTSKGDTNFEEIKQGNIQACIKNAYGEPYIPGSGLKGALRTILLANSIQHMKKKEEIKRKVLDYQKNYVIGIKNGTINRKKEKKKYLKDVQQKLEKLVFSTLGLSTGNRTADAILNDKMRCIRIGDSKPLTTKDLVLCRKIDVSIKGQPCALPQYRECIRLGIEIEFPLTIHTKLYPITPEDIKKAIQSWYQTYIDNYISLFPVDQEWIDGGIYVGGGSGYVTKSILYSLFEKEEAVKVVDEMFQKTLDDDYDKHHHNLDVSKGIAPHMLKCTYLEGKLKQFGLCELEIQ